MRTIERIVVIAALAAAFGGGQPAGAQQAMRVDRAYRTRGSGPAPNFSPKGMQVPMVDVAATATLPEGALRPARTGYVGVKLDGDLEKALATKFNVAGFPAMIVLGPGGKELARAAGCQSSKQMLTLLNATRQPDR